MIILKTTILVVLKVPIPDKMTIFRSVEVRKKLKPWELEFPMNIDACSFKLVLLHCLQYSDDWNCVDSSDESSVGSTVRSCRGKLGHSIARFTTNSYSLKKLYNPVNWCDYSENNHFGCTVTTGTVLTAVMRVVLVAPSVPVESSWDTQLRDSLQIHIH